VELCVLRPALAALFQKAESLDSNDVQSERDQRRFTFKTAYSICFNLEDVIVLEYDSLVSRTDDNNSSIDGQVTMNTVRQRYMYSAYSEWEMLPENRRYIQPSQTEDGAL
jgi:hypothetical protein